MNFGMLTDVSLSFTFVSPENGPNHFQYLFNQAINVFCQIDYLYGEAFETKILQNISNFMDSEESLKYSGETNNSSKHKPN